jgi:poly-gamma-glutamate capsule biosynthesis protein CapA/YwtB (metallophosphatase superfamily)
MSSSSLPSTPIEVLDISTPETLALIMDEVNRARQTGAWEYPDPESATDLAEMTFKDICQWVYKCETPITHIEKGAETMLLTDPSIVDLPQGFETTSSLTMGFGGDLLHADGLELSQDVLFENVADLLFDKDVSYANIESVITNGELIKESIGDKAAPIECCNREQHDIRTRHQDKTFDVIITANNHANDRGEEGLRNTQQALEEAGILNVGTNSDPADYGRGKTLERNNIRLGFTAVTFGLNGNFLPEGEEYRIHTSSLMSKSRETDLELAKQQIDDCKHHGCDFIIASMHWGFEFEMFPRKRQIEAARALIEYGADAIICHHPHVIQPVEYYRTQRDPNRVATIAYSLGSLTWGFTAPHLVLSAIQNLTLAKGNFQGEEKTYIADSVVTPVFRSAVDVNGQTLTRLEKLADHTDGKNDRHSLEYIGQIKRYADLVLGG